MASTGEGSPGAGILAWAPPPPTPQCWRRPSIQGTTSAHAAADKPSPPPPPTNNIEPTCLPNEPAKLRQAHPATTYCTHRSATPHSPLRHNHSIYTSPHDLPLPPFLPLYVFPPLLPQGEREREPLRHWVPPLPVRARVSPGVRLALPPPPLPSHLKGAALPSPPLCAHLVCNRSGIVPQ